MLIQYTRYLMKYRVRHLPWPQRCVQAGRARNLRRAEVGRHINRDIGLRRWQSHQRRSASYHS